jgi:hypothetical protein
MHQVIARILAILLALQPWATGLALSRAKTNAETSSLSNPNTGFGNKDQQQTAQPRVASQVLSVFTSQDAVAPSSASCVQPRLFTTFSSSRFENALRGSERLFARYEKWIE